MKRVVERRNFKTEVRVKKAGEDRTIEGHASVFNTPYTLADWFGEIVEIVAPGAFSRAIAEKQDVRCLFNHDPNHVLGRTKSGTLQISEDNVGLAYTCNPPANNHVVDAIERGDVDGSSFGFIVVKDQWVDERDDKGRVIKSTRTIQDVDLFDVSPVTFPANDAATVGIRSLFPQGMPAEFRSRYEARNTKCKCECDPCMDGRCAECSNPDCDDPNCEGEDGERSKKHPKPARAKRAEACECACAECRDSKCADCSDPECDDPNCTEERSAHRKKEAAPVPVVEPPVDEANAAQLEIERRKRLAKLLNIQTSLDAG
jgi:uncharacterized protein